MKYAVILLVVLLSGCTGCLEKLYSVHEPSPSINIPVDTKLSEQRINDIIDSVNLIYEDSCTYPSMLESNGNRVLYTGHCEGYLVEVDNKQVSVIAIYHPKYNKDIWLTVMKQIDTSLVAHAKNRMSEVFR